ncbi:DUF5803 family protein [Methanospirillum stamsii]|uniref:Uncharacterized protein n=2 Tax=Methanospirillum stamsii TaxID=1277351 RepID=A0A2V2MRH5_9EURY|nr:hypothetical protein DLD82_14620 [Methanospirillum stamsii]
MMMPVAGINLSATVHDDGERYSAIVLVNNTERYDLIQPGMVGERIPLDVQNVSVRNDSSELSIKPDRGVLTFPPGNYTIRYDAPITAKTIQFLFTEPANATVLLPHPYRIGNPLLTSMQPSGLVTTWSNNSTTVSWNNVRSVELRYYDEKQEHLLFLFAQFWLIIAVVLLLPFFLSRK